MSSLSMKETELWPGFRFHPTDDELICDYLMKRRLVSCEEELSLMIDVDLNKCEPWDIPETACVGGNQWYFYSQRDRKYATGIRMNRATVSGYWKATGKDRPVVKKGRLVGMRKTLVFHQGRAPKGRNTDWVMHEFRLEGPLGPPKLPSSSKDQDWVLCRVFNKSSKRPAKPSMPQATTSHSTDVETGSLPVLADSYSMIFFDQTPRPTTTNTATNHDVYDEQVPCFSILNPDETNPLNFPQLFNMEEPNSKSMIIAPSIGISHPQDEILATTATATSSFSMGNKHVVNAVLSQLTKMEDSTACNTKSSSPRSLGEVVSSESYLCDHVDLATIWSNHYY